MWINFYYSSMRTFNCYFSVLTPMARLMTIKVWLINKNFRKHQKFHCHMFTDHVFNLFSHLARDSKNFLNILSEWTYDETDERMKQRVEFSQRAISKLIRSFDRIVQQNEKICSLLQPPGYLFMLTLILRVHSILFLKNIVKLHF